MEHLHRHHGVDHLHRAARRCTEANPCIGIFDEMGGSGDGRCEGRHNALVAVTAPLLLSELRAFAYLAKALHSRQAPAWR